MDGWNTVFSFFGAKGLLAGALGVSLETVLWSVYMYMYIYIHMIFSFILYHIHAKSDGKCRIFSTSPIRSRFLWKPFLLCLMNKNPTISDGWLFWLRDLFQIYILYSSCFNIVVCMTCVYIQDMQKNIYMKHNSLPDTLLFDTLV